MSTLELETMRCELDSPLPHLARLRFNRPEALNAANWAWVNDLVSATNYLAQSAETRVVIVSGEGHSFCSGLDTKEQIDASFETDTAALMATFIKNQEDCLRSPEHAAVMEEYRQQQARRSNKTH